MLVLLMLLIMLKETPGDEHELHTMNMGPLWQEGLSMGNITRVLLGLFCCLKMLVLMTTKCVECNYVITINVIIYIVLHQNILEIYIIEIEVRNVYGGSILSQEKSIIGALQNLIITRPDIAYASNKFIIEYHEY
ncbi:hypothetical protein ACJX0J_019590 [Zea mays]